MKPVTFQRPWCGWKPLVWPQSWFWVSRWDTGVDGFPYSLWLSGTAAPTTGCPPRTMFHTQTPNRPPAGWGFLWQTQTQRWWGESPGHVCRRVRGTVFLFWVGFLSFLLLLGCFSLVSWIFQSLMEVDRKWRSPQQTSQVMKPPLQQITFKVPLWSTLMITQHDWVNVHDPEVKGIPPPN